MTISNSPLSQVGAFRRHAAAAVSLGKEARRQWWLCAAIGAVITLCGCATHREAWSRASGKLVLADPQVSRFGTVAVAFLGESSPASTGFQKAKGRKGTLKEAFLDSAEIGLGGPGAGVIVAGEVLSLPAWGGDPIYEAAFAGAVGGVAAVGAALVGPAVGAKGLIRSMEKVSPAELEEREAALREALSQMAQQQRFHDALLQSGSARVRDGFFSPDSANSHWSSGPDAILEARVDDLRLERAGAGEGSYFLRIRTHARLVRVADGRICFEQPAEYCSATALCLDWTLNGAVEGVAETGYQALADYYVSKLLR